MKAPEYARSFRVSRGAAWAIALVLGVPSSAGAEWMLSAFVGGASTASNTLHVNAGTRRVDLEDVVYAAESWRSPIYYGWRVTHRWQAHPWFGLEAAFTHAKAIADTSGRAIILRFELSHGLNLAIVNVVISKPLGRADRLAVVVRGGAGAAVPHVEATLMDGSSSDRYQIAGPAWEAGAGVELRIWRDAYVVGDVRASNARVTANVGNATIAGSFWTAHLDTGIAWKLGGREPQGRGAGRTPLHLTSK